MTPADQSALSAIARETLLAAVMEPPCEEDYADAMSRFDRADVEAMAS